MLTFAAASLFKASGDVSGGILFTPNSQYFLYPVSTASLKPIPTPFIIPAFSFPIESFV